MKRLIFTLILLAMQATMPLFANTNDDNEHVRQIIKSNSRILIPLSGAWNRTDDGMNWETVSIPFSEAEDKTITYTKSIRIEKDMVESRTWHLMFLGFNQQSEIFFNEQFVGRYYSGMSPLFIRIPEKMLNSGANELKIVLTPVANATKQVHTQFIKAKNRFAGIIREVYLVGTPPVWISNVNYKTNLTNNFQNASLKSTISISTGNIEQLAKFKTKDTAGIVVSRSKSNLTVENTLVRISTGEVVATGEQKQITIESERTIQVDVNMNITNPSLWSPDNPNLYELRTRLTQSGKLIDDFSTNIGFRDIKTPSENNNKFLLNGERIDLKAVVYVEDHGTTGQSLSFWRMEEDVASMKTLGANAVRFKFNPPHPYFAYLCDKYGLMMLIELPLYYVPSTIIHLDEVKVLMKNYSKQYVAAYQNHPSLIAFGISESLNEDDYPIELSKEYSNILKAAQRHLIYKIIPYNSDIVKSDGFDFIGISLSKDYAKSAFNSYYINRLKNLLEGTPYLLSFGSAVQNLNHNGYSDPLSLEHQAYFIRNNFILAKDGLGVIINSFNDYKLNHPYLATNNDDIYVITSGLTDRYRNQRLSYTMLQSLFNDEKEPLLNAGSYAESTPITFIIFGLFLIATLLFVNNRYRRFREYFFRSLLRPYNFYSDIRDQRIMSSLQTVLLGLVVSFTIGIFLASLAYYYRMDEITQYAFMMKFPSNSVQEVLYRMIWMPEISLLIISIITFLVVFIFSTIIKMFAFFSRARIFYTDSLIITIWSGIPYLLLLPIGIILVRLLEISDFFALAGIVLFILLSIWVVMRILKACSVVFDKSPLQVYLIGLILLIIVVGIPLGIYQMKYSLFAYLNYFFEVVV